MIKLFTSFCCFLAILFLSGCHSGVLAPKGPIAHQELQLLIFSVALMLLVVIPVIVMTFWFGWRYRASANAKYRPEWSHSYLLEAICWGVPCLIIFILAAVTWFTTHSLDPYKPLDSTAKPVNIQVVALDWKWLFIYPEEKIASINEITIPLDRPINFDLTAAAPMNSFIIPQLAGQIYAMTGMKTQLHLIAKEPGRYRGFSANYTGYGFAGMQFYVQATSEENFQNWIKSVKASPKTLTWDIFWQNLVKRSVNDPVTYFGQVQTNLFDDIVMYYMMPDYTPEQH